MIRLGVAPRLVDFTRGALAAVEGWFNAVTARFNINPKAGAMTTAEVPTNQWGIFKNTSTNQVSLIVNDAGTLKSTRMGPTPVVMAIPTTATNLTSGVLTKITLDAETYDTDNFFDIGTSKFLPTVPGYYYIDATLTVKQLTATSNVILSDIHVNGATFLQSAMITPAVVADFSLQVSGMVLLNGTTDFVELYGFQNSGVARNTTPTLTRFSAMLVRPT